MTDRMGMSDFAAAFPLLRDARPGLHYLDNAATTHKPDVVIDAISACYRSVYGPVHRGLYPLAEAASDLYEQARATVAAFIGVNDPHEVIFTRSATESINLVARGWGSQHLGPEKAVWVSRLEHHANYLPWQAVCNEQGARMGIIELQSDGALDIEACEGLFSDRTGLIAISLVSNVTGSIQPVRDLIKRAHRHGIIVLVDACQAVGHIELDVADLGCDFLVMSGHKFYGPTGIGVLYGRRELLEQTEPLLLGGGMVDWVGERHSQWSGLPAKLEAGSPNLAGAAGLAAALRFLNGFAMSELHAHARYLASEAIDRLQRMAGLSIYAPELSRTGTGIVSFNVGGVHPHDLGQIAGEQGVAIRAGHHCCQPLMQHFDVAATARASFAPYNTLDDVDALVAAVERARTMFA